MPEIGKWEYIGDGVYVCHDGYGIQLHANSHIDPTDRIYLEPYVLERLVEFKNNIEGV